MDCSSEHYNLLLLNSAPLQGAAFSAARWDELKVPQFPSGKMLVKLDLSTYWKPADLSGEKIKVYTKHWGVWGEKESSNIFCHLPVCKVSIHPEPGAKRAILASVQVHW